MDGVTWDWRAESDWLASNGRWYPRSSYPSGWGRSALPPAPEHTQAGSILRQLTSQLTALADDDDAHEPGIYRGDEDVSPQSDPGPIHRRAATHSGSIGKMADARQAAVSRIADAAVVSQRTYVPKVSAGPKPPPKLPPPPGRISDGDGDPDVAAAPTSANDRDLPPPPVLRSKATTTQSKPNDFDVVAGDLGKVLGVAKRRIEKAINEASAGER